ncbi:exodeoxyribonuclease VII small subunit [Bdellovibrionota bacterium FG-1]
MTDSNNPMSFEAALEQLQVTVKRLESGELSLEQSLKAFEEGVRLTRTCQEQLSGAEKRVELLMKANTDGTVELQPFSPQRG